MEGILVILLSLLGLILYALYRHKANRLDTAENKARELTYKLEAAEIEAERKRAASREETARARAEADLAAYRRANPKPGERTWRPGEGETD